MNILTCRGPRPRSREHFATIRQNGRFLLALIDDLLDISRIEAGELRIECEPCSPVGDRRPRRSGRCAERRKPSI